MESGFYQLNQDAQCSRKLLPRLNAFEEKPPKEYKDHGRGPDVLLSAVSARSSPISAVGEHSSASNANAGAVFSGKNDLMMSSSPEIRMQRGSQNDFELEKNFCHHAVKRQREIQSIHEHPIDFSNNLPRALIQAYGSSKPSNSHPEMPSKFQKLGDKRMRTDTTIRKWKNSEEEEYLWDNMSPTLTDPSIHMKPTKHDIPQGTYSAEACLRKSNASTPSSWSMPTRHNTTERTVMLDQREAVNGLGQRPGNGEYNVSAEKGQYLHSQSIYRGRDSWTADHMQSSKVPAQSSGLPTVCHRRPPSNYPTGSDALMQRPVNSQSDSVDTASLPSLPPASANNHVLRQTYIPSSHSMHPFKAELPSQSSSIPLKPFQYAGHSNSVGSGKSMLRHGTSLSPSTFSNDTYREPSEPRVLMAASGECSVLHPLAPECHSSVPQSHFLPRESCGNKEPPARTYDAVLPPGHLAEHVQISSSTSQFLSSPSCDLHPSSVIMGRKSGNPDLQYGGALPSLPPRMHTNAQMQSAAHNTGTMITNSAGNGHIGLISSLISKGLISLPSVAAPKDFVSLEFNHEHLKARNQSVVDNLYDNIPRQCRTCGLRFRCQEKHSTHMDWHVTKNRVLKNCKQKPSRKWFVSAKEWLSGAETLGIDPAPGFLTAETITERREDNEMAVPADVNQKFCALCGEAFEDFFSDEADEWMYKEAVYLNSQERRVHEYGRSLLGPIVHAKCRPISSNK